MSKCDIFLENYLNVYYAGQQIIGYVQCTFTEEKNVKGIVIRFKGEANTEWTESESHYNSTTKKNETRSVRYSGDECYFSTELNLLHNNGEDTVIPAGIHKYPFNFTLPTNIPSSFDGAHGKVFYTIKATVKRPFLKFDYEAQSEFNLVSLIDLNLQPHLKEAACVRKNKNLCCWCWKSGPITAELSLPRTGFAIGQKVDIYLYIENMANASIESVKFTIKQTIEFIAEIPSRKTRHSHDVITSETFSGVGAHGSRTYEESLTIPQQFSAPNLNGCTIMSVSYEFLFKAKLPCPHSNIVGTILIAIGHKAIEGTNASQQYPLPNYNSVVMDNPTAPILEGPSAPPVDNLIGWNTQSQQDLSTGKPMVMPAAPSMPMPSVPSMPMPLIPSMNVPISTDINFPPPSYDQAMNMNRPEKE